MTKVLKLLFVLFLLFGCVNKKENEVSGHNAVAELEILEELEIADTAPTVSRYVIDERFLETAKQDLETIDKFSYYSNHSQNVGIFKKIYFENNMLQIASGTTYPSITIWQDDSGEFLYQFLLDYDYFFDYVKNGITKNAYISLSYGFGTGQRNGANTLKINAKLHAGGNTFLVAYKDGKFVNDADGEENYGNAIVFTEDLHNKLVKIFEEFETNRFVESDGELLDPIIEHIKEECPTMNINDEYTYIKDGTAYFDYIAPLYNYFEMPYYHNILTNYYVVGRDELYGVINEKGKVVVPILSTIIPQVCENNEIHVMIGNEVCPNGNCEIEGTPYRYGGQHGTTYIDHRRDDTQLYQYTQGHDGPSILTKIEKPIDVKNMPLIPFEAITNVHTEMDPDGSWEYLTSTNLHKKGLMDTNGKVVADPIYDDIFTVTGRLIPVMRNGKWGYEDSKGKEVIPCEFEPIVRVSYGEWRNDNYFDTYGNNRPNAVRDNYVVVKKNGKYGVLDLNGNVVIPFEYEAMSYYLSNSFIMRKGDKWYVKRIKESMEEVEMPLLRKEKEKQSINSYYTPTEEELDKILKEIDELPFVNGKYSPGKTYKYSKRFFAFGWYDEAMLEIDFLEDDQEYTLGAFEYYKREKEYGKQGEKVRVICSRNYTGTDSLNKISVFAYADSNNYGVRYDWEKDKYFNEIEGVEVEEELQKVIESAYQEMQSLFLSESELAKVLSIVEKGMTSSTKSSIDTSGYSYIDDIGYDSIQPLMNSKFKGVRYFEIVKDYYCFKKNGKYGLVNNNGLVVIEPEADEPFVLIDNYEIMNYYGDRSYIPFTPYVQGAAHGLQSGNYYYDEKSKQVMQIGYADDGPGSYSYVDILPFPLARVRTFDYIWNSPNWDKSKNISETYGIINKAGELVVEPKYDNVIAYDSTFLPVQINGDWGYVNAMGEEVIPCEYQGIIQAGTWLLPYPVINDKYVILKDKENKMGVMDIQGRVIVPFEYDLIGAYYEGKVVVFKKGEKRYLELEE